MWQKLLECSQGRCSYQLEQRGEEKCNASAAINSHAHTQPWRRAISRSSVSFDSWGGKKEKKERENATIDNIYTDNTNGWRSSRWNTCWAAPHRSITPHFSLTKDRVAAFSQRPTLPSSVIYLCQQSYRSGCGLSYRLQRNREVAKDIKWLWHPRHHL